MLNRHRERIVRSFENTFSRLSVLQLRPSYAMWTLSLVNPSRHLTYVASIYVIRLTRDISRCFLISFSSYSVSRPFGQSTFRRLRHRFTKRHVADRILGVEVRKRITATDSTFGEKVAATAVCEDCMGCINCCQDKGYCHTLNNRTFVRFC